jgi:hypothetical protein
MMRITVSVKAYEEIVKDVLKAVQIKEDINCEKWSDALEYARGLKEVTFKDKKYTKKEISCWPTYGGI